MHTVHLQSDFKLLDILYKGNGATQFSPLPEAISFLLFPEMRQKYRNENV